jgi:hypothetical protein
VRKVAIWVVEDELNGVVYDENDCEYLISWGDQ